jgi:hypothetical protein
MCEPVSMSILAVGSLGLQIYGLKKQQEAADAAEAQGYQNAEASKVAAVQVQDEAGYEASRLQMRADQLVGHIRVVGAAGNADLSRGNPVRLQTDATFLSKIDQKVIEMRGVQKAAGFITQGKSFSAQAAVTAAQGTADSLAAMGGILGTAAKLGQQGYEWWKSNQAPNDPGFVSSPQPIGAPGDIMIG